MAAAAIKHPAWMFEAARRQSDPCFICLSDCLVSGEYLNGKKERKVSKIVRSLKHTERD